MPQHLRRSIQPPNHLGCPLPNATTPHMQHRSPTYSSTLAYVASETIGRGVHNPTMGILTRVLETSTPSQFGTYKHASSSNATNTRQSRILEGSINDEDLLELWDNKMDEEFFDREINHKYSDCDKNKVKKSLIITHGWPVSIGLDNYYIRKIIVNALISQLESSDDDDYNCSSSHRKYNLSNKHRKINPDKEMKLEANMAGDPEPKPSPKRLKTLTDANPKPQIEGHDDTSSKSERCGICLFEGGSEIRGEIDSCSHVFCFICIMEWAKVESRCPLCKQRFGSIRRAPKPGVFPTLRVVQVLVRDQVYRISGNATIGPPDPYSNVQCCICNTVGDENLLLLCDLCNSASHTHCVGLGATVPEGDWFCHDCTLSKAEHEKIEEKWDAIDEKRNTNIDGIVRPYRPREMNHMNITPMDNSETNPIAATRTLRHCRNVHLRVKALRANWNAIRNGSLNFDSSSVNLHINENAGSNQSQSSSTSTSASSQKVASGRSSSDGKCSNSSYDVDKAWKMMNKAKSMKQDQGRNKTINQSPKHLLRKIDNPFEDARSKSLLVLSSSKSCSSKGDIRNRPQIFTKKNQGVESTCNNSKFGVASTRLISRFCESRSNSHSIKDLESPSSMKFHTSDRGEMSRKRLQVLPSDLIINSHSVKLDNTSSSKMDIPNGKVIVGNDARKDDA